MQGRRLRLGKMEIGLVLNELRHGDVLGAGGLLRWKLHARRNKRTVGCNRAATRGGSFGGNDRCIASWSAIGGQEHLIVGALHRAICRIARGANDSNARGGAGWTLIAFGARGSGRPAIALRSLTLTATHHSAGQHNRNEGPEETHGDAMARSARIPQREDCSPARRSGTLRLAPLG